MVVMLLCVVVRCRMIMLSLRWCYVVVYVAGMLLLCCCVRLCVVLRCSMLLCAVACS